MLLSGIFVGNIRIIGGLFLTAFLITLAVAVHGQKRQKGTKAEQFYEDGSLRAEGELLNEEKKWDMGLLLP